MRSKLFVPGSRPEFFSKALAGAADGLSFDLEDSVAPSAKDRARAELKALFESDALRASDKTIIVRVNAFDTPWFKDDVAAVVRGGLHLVNLPKPDSADQVRAAAQAIAAAEAANGVSSPPVKLLLNIETPRGLRIAHELAGADPKVAGLQLGLADLFEPTGIVRSDIEAVRQAMFATRMAAAEAGVFAFDSSHADIRNTDAFVAEAAISRGLGFLGKSCIHPSQVALANEAFRPSEAEIAHALKVLAAAREAARAGVGAYVVDGAMVDPPFVMRAEATVALARRLGLVPPEGSAGAPA